MKLKPTEDRIIVKPAPAEEMSPGGIILQPNKKDRPTIGEVIAIGPGKMADGKMVKVALKPGDIVFYTKYTGSEISSEGIEYIIMKETDVLAVEG